MEGNIEEGKRRFYHLRFRPRQDSALRFSRGELFPIRYR